jgi:hypothetical protein
MPTRSWDGRIYGVGDRERVANEINGRAQPRGVQAAAVRPANKVLCAGRTVSLSHRPVHPNLRMDQPQEIQTCLFSAHCPKSSLDVLPVP